MISSKIATRVIFSFLSEIAKNKSGISSPSKSSKSSPTKKRSPKKSSAVKQTPKRVIVNMESKPKSTVYLSFRRQTKISRAKPKRGTSRPRYNMQPEHLLHKAKINLKTSKSKSFRL